MSTELWSWTLTPHLCYFSLDFETINSTTPVFFLIQCKKVNFIGSYKLYFLYKSTEVMRRTPPAINKLFVFILSLNDENLDFGWRKKSSSSSISTISSISSSISSSTCAHLHSTWLIYYPLYFYKIGFRRWKYNTIEIGMSHQIPILIALCPTI